jgi:hypothetical protein
MPSTMSTPKCALEALADLGRQRFAGRRHQAQGHVRGGQPRVGQHAGKAGGGAVEHGGLHAAHAAQPALEGGVGRGPLGHQQRGGAHAHREGERVAQAVGEEQLGGREADVALDQAQHRLAVQLAGPVGVGCCAPCPWAGRWTRWSTARRPGRRRRWPPASAAVRRCPGSSRTRLRPGAAAPPDATPPPSAPHGRSAPCRRSARAAARPTPAPPGRGCAPACRRSRPRSAGC